MLISVKVLGVLADLNLLAFSITAVSTFSLIAEEDISIVLEDLLPVFSAPDRMLLASLRLGTGNSVFGVTNE